MANPDHLIVLVEATAKYQKGNPRGPEPSVVWNRWRENNPDIQPDLLGGLGLPTGLRGEDIYFREIDLRNANLSWCTFIRSDMDNADLRGADLRWVRFDATTLSGADLRSANLWGAVFSDCVLNGADFTGAQVGRAVLTNVDISLCKGLDAVTIPQGETQNPITIGIDTFEKSKGAVPEKLLRLAGVSDAVKNSFAALFR